MSNISTDNHGSIVSTCDSTLGGRRIETMADSFELEVNLETKYGQQLGSCFVSVLGERSLPDIGK